MEEERLKQKIADRTIKKKIQIFSLRIFINIIVIAVLLACFYCIFRATVFSQENSSVSIRHNIIIDYIGAGDLSKNYCERVKYPNTEAFV